MSYWAKAIEYSQKVQALVRQPQVELARIDEVQKIVVKSKPLFCYVTDAFNGTCRFFACVFTFFGVWLAFRGKLTADYVALVGSIQTLIVTHSVAQDYHARNSDPSKP